VIDTSFLPEASGAGFFISGGPDVTKVDISAPDTVALTLSAALPNTGSYTVEYASVNGTTSVALKMPPIFSVTTGKIWSNGQDGYELTFTGDLQDQLQTTLLNGVFDLQNDQNAAGTTSGTIRSVTLDASGNTLLKGESRELNNGINFVQRQLVTVKLMFPYGNIRDSDPESSIYQFVSGPRVGQPYPLWNWSVGFDGLKIATGP
jgi:hypothetical protein